VPVAGDRFLHADGGLDFFAHRTPKKRAELARSLALKKAV
jgi:hypothetical protein